MPSAEDAWGNRSVAEGDLVSFSSPEITETDIDAVTDVLRRGWITTGKEALALEQELADYLEVPEVVALSSCTAALEIATAHLDLPTGTRVGVPTWTFASTAFAAVRQGLEVVLLDIDPDTLNLSVDATERAIESGIGCLIPVHFGGVPVERMVLDLCEDAGVAVVEDAAHALGAADHRGSVAGRGTIGAAFSFYATKNLTSGEGGALATENPDLARFARSFRLHGMDRDAWARYRPGSSASYDVTTPGIKANLPDLLAALARSQLARFDRSQRHRRTLVDRYRQNLGQVEGLRFAPTEPRSTSADHLVVVVLPEDSRRSDVVAELQGHGIGTSVHFTPLHRFTWFRHNAVADPGGTPSADALWERVLSLPLHLNLAVYEIDHVCEALVGALRR